MKRKLLLYSYDWAPSVGGVQTVTMDLARGICEWSKAHSEEAWEVTLVTQTPADGMDDSALPFRVVRGRSTRQLVRLIRSADLLHFAGPALLPMAFSFALGRPFVVEHHGYHSICPNGLLLFGPNHELCPGHFMAGRYSLCVQCNSGRVGLMKSAAELLTNFPRRWLCRHARANIAVTDHVSRRIDLPRTKTILHGIPVTEGVTTKPAAPREKLEIAYLGRFVAEKGVSTLIESASELKKMGVAFHLTLIGDGPERQKLDGQVRACGLMDSVSFPGYLTGAALQEKIRSVAAVVIPSRCEETAGLSAMEQMMRGGVVVAANIGGLAEIVGNGGILFKPMDSHELAVILSRMAGDPNSRSEIAARARARALEAFRLECMVEEHLNLYRNVLNC